MDELRASEAGLLPHGALALLVMGGSSGHDPQVGPFPSHTPDAVGSPQVPRVWNGPSRLPLSDPVPGAGEVLWDKIREPQRRHFCCIVTTGSVVFLPV